MHNKFGYKTKSGYKKGSTPTALWLQKAAEPGDVSGPKGQYCLVTKRSKLIAQEKPRAVKVDISRLVVVLWLVKVEGGVNQHVVVLHLFHRIFNLREDGVQGFSLLILFLTGFSSVLYGR
jgi:hypothetical protein